MTPEEDIPAGRGEAVALTYAAGDAAPRVIAKGRGLIAQEIIERAREAGIYVHESPELVSLLMQVDLDAHIPAQLYVAVAELLAWLYRVEQGADAGAPPSGKSLADLLGPRPAETDGGEAAESRPEE
jgi:flagellar biosynthesis protein